MNQRLAIQVDDRDQNKIFEQLLHRRLGFVPEWRPEVNTPGAALGQIFARYLAGVLRRLNQAPEKNKLAFLDTLGVYPVSARAARAPIVFRMSKDAVSGRIGAGAAVGAPPPPGSNDPIIFETERAFGVMKGRIQQAVSLWPGRDSYIDHSESLLENSAFRLFEKSALEPVPHELFLAHDTLLALTGSVNLSLEFELRQGSSEHLRIRWQFWNGELWRDFLDFNPSCIAAGESQRDSTDGLQNNGRVQLIADCAEAKQREVNGITAFWIRGSLEEAIPPNPNATLPEVDSIRISSIVAQPLKAKLEALEPRPEDGLQDTLQVQLLNEAGQPVNGAQVVATGEDGSTVLELLPPAGGSSGTTDGLYEYASFPFGQRFDFTVTLDELEVSVGRGIAVTSTASRVDLILTVDGLAVDNAFADLEKLDVSKPFFPLGLQPQPGATFYFSSEEVLSKPGAAVRMYLPTTGSPQDETSVSATSVISVATNVTEELSHEVSWEYWNSRKWVPFLRSSTSDPKRDFTETEILDFTVPLDIARTTVNDQEAFWIRAKVLRGGYGFRAEVRWTDGVSSGASNSFVYVVPQPPSLADIRLGYSWQYGPFRPERAFTYNDFRYKDHTDAVQWPGPGFQPFERVEDVTPALYLGLDEPPPVDLLGIYFDVEEQTGVVQGPALRWEYFDGVSWRNISVNDETERLRAPGIVSFLGPNDLASLPRFGRPLYWVRARLKEDGPPGEATLRGIFPNTVWASQRRTLRDSMLGVSNGTPNQEFLFAERPVVPGEAVEVRELAGPRAQVEWRILALELSGGDTRIVTELEQQLGREGPQTDFVYGALRLKRDRDKRVAEAWVRWSHRPHLFFSGPEDRHYAVDRAQGRIVFGNSENGKIPPAASAIMAREFAAGGGAIGNVRAGEIKQLMAEVPGAEAVFNVRAGEGGADGETLERFSRRGPETVRHRGRAITSADYETMSREASPAVAFARAVPTRSPAGRPLPGWVTLLVIPYGDEPRPTPSIGLRRLVREYIESRAPADLAGYSGIHVVGPDYFPVDVAATVSPREASAAGAVESRVREAVERFLHPLHGGPEGRGWELGRDIYLSDLASVLERVDGVDYVEELAMLRDGVPQGERIAVDDDRVAVAGRINLKLRTAEGVQ